MNGSFHILIIIDDAQGIYSIQSCTGAPWTVVIQQHEYHQPDRLQLMWSPRMYIHYTVYEYIIHQIYILNIIFVFCKCWFSLVVLFPSTRNMFYGGKMREIIEERRMLTYTHFDPDMGTFGIICFRLIKSARFIIKIHKLCKWHSIHWQQSPHAFMSRERQLMAKYSSYCLDIRNIRISTYIIIHFLR